LLKPNENASVGLCCQTVLRSPYSSVSFSQ
jgi:hypothetical protein